MAIRGQSVNQIDREIDWTTVARMLNLKDILELVNNGFNDSLLTQQDFIQLSTIIAYKV